MTAITVTRVSQKQTSRYLGSLNQPSPPLPLAWYNKADHNTLPMANPQINLDWNLVVLTYAKASLSPPGRYILWILCYMQFKVDSKNQTSLH